MKSEERTALRRESDGHHRRDRLGALLNGACAVVGVSLCLLAVREGSPSAIGFGVVAAAFCGFGAYALTRRD